MPKPLKLILGMFVGFATLGLLSYLAVIFVFNTRTATVSSNEIVAVDSVSGYVGGKMMNPSAGTNTGDVSIMPVLPIYDNGGDGSKLVKTATVSLTVKDFDKAVASVKALVSQYKGYVLNMYDSGVVNERTVTVSVRVPSDKFDSALIDFKALGVTVVSSSENSDDISSTYKDIQARLKNQKAYEKQLLAILEKATKVNDILEIQREISQVRQEIELMQSQLKSYDTQVSMSVINISMSKASEALNVAGEGWKPQGVFAEALTALVSFATGFANLLIWTVVFSPIILVPYGIYYFAKKGKK